MNTVAKAIVAAATYVGGWVATATQGIEGAGAEITSAELAIGVAGTVAAFFLVWAVPNKPEQP